MEYSTASGEDTVTCPYNSIHRVLRKHLQSHLVKCRLSYPNVELMKCPFNAAHLIHEPEFNYHVKNCPDKALVTNYKYNIDVPKAADVKITPQPRVESEDNWDDVDVETYNPEKYASKAPIIRSKIGDLPSQKKAFRESERRRHNEIDIDLDSSDEDDE